MRNSFLRIILGFYALTGSVAEAHSFNATSFLIEPDHSELTPLVERLRSGPGEGPCDRKNFTAMLEIARQIDSRRSVIESYTKSQSSSAKYRKVQFGPLTALQLRIPQKPKGGWQIRIRGWPALIAAYRKIQGEGTAQQWFELNGKVRSVLADDEDRILSGWNYDTGHLDEDRLQNIRHAFIVWREKKALDQDPPFMAADLEWMKRHPTFSKIWKVMPSDHLLERVKRLVDLEKKVQIAASNFGFYKNESVTRVGEELRLPLVAGVFESVKEEIARYVESFWKSEKLRLKIQWMTVPDPSTFRLLFPPGSSGRSWVSFQDKAVNYYSNQRITAFPHEIGHVLGFLDRYYTVWSEERCQYETEYRDDDLMSNDENSSVQKSDFEVLNQVYPAKNTALN